jgi:hypothetical protein
MGRRSNSANHPANSDGLNETDFINRFSPNIEPRFAGLFFRQCFCSSVRVR